MNGKSIPVIRLAAAMAAIVGACPVFAQIDPGPKPLPSSPARRNYESAFFPAMDAYNRTRQQHMDDPVDARWTVLPGGGHKLSPTGGGSIALVAYPAAGSETVTFGVTLIAKGCSPEVERSTAALVVAGWHASFKGQCKDDMNFYVPADTDDAVRFRRLIEQSPSMQVAAFGQTVRFDVSSVLVVEALVALEALGPPPD